MFYTCADPASPSDTQVWDDSAEGVQVDNFSGDFTFVDPVIQSESTGTSSRVIAGDEGSDTEIEHRSHTSTSDGNTEGDASLVVAESSGETMYSRLLCLFIILFTRITSVCNLTQTAIVVILGLIKLVVGVFPPDFATLLPSSVYTLKSTATPSVALPQTTIYAVCERCHNVVLLDEAWEETEGKKTSRKCNNQRPRNRQCGNELMKHTIRTGQWVHLAPHKTYRVLPPSKWLRFYMKQREFDELLECKLKHHRIADRLDEMWDGRIWQDFLTDSRGNELLIKKHNFGLMLYVDWFKPFKHNQYKVAGIFMSVLDLPRDERMKQRWTMLVSIIPGPHEPETHQLILGTDSG